MAGFSNAIVIVADDLTGACDSGVAFVASGRAVRVVLDAARADLERVRLGDVWAVSTETRDLGVEQAKARVGDCIVALRPAVEKGLLFKKVDSAARGYFGVEVVAALRASGAAVALVAPSFPAAGRMVAGGVLRVRDCGGQDAAVNLRELFPLEDAGAVGVLAAGSVRDLELEIAHEVARGARILLCDSETQEDLERLAEAGLRVHGRILWVGSAGLAHALAGLVGMKAGAMGPMRRGGRTVLFVGTTHSVTNIQVAELEREQSEVDRAVHRVPCVGASELDVVAAFREGAVEALILTGGDTAAFVLRALGASGILLGGEIARGIPWGIVEGGLADGNMVVTKSGGFGEPDALVRAFEFCERRSCDVA